MMAVLLGAALAAQGQESTGLEHPLPTLDTAGFGAKIQRTMTLLATSTPQHRHTVKILFYGQSITKQEWSKTVADYIRKQFPNADLVIENRAIGGFAANLLKRSAEHDLYPFYPDLVIFHDYGGEPDYESIIANLRRRTTAEILLQNDHVAAGQQDSKAQAWHDQHSFVWMPQLAARFEGEMADIRHSWKQYLEANHLEPSALLVDGVHLNEQGNHLLAALITPHLRYAPELPGQTWQNLTRTVVVGKDARWKNNRLVLEFDGNRVDVIAAPAKNHSAHTASIRIDGKKPSEFPECYAFSRPNADPHRDWPWETGAIIRVGSQAPLVVETWTARITEINKETGKFAFTVSGSKTGLDGSGTGDQKFVSNSGRVVIEPEDWWLKEVKPASLVGPGFEVTWQVVPLFQDTYAPPTIEDPTRETATTLAQGLPNGKHRLEILADSGGSVPIQAIRIYRPPFP